MALNVDAGSITQPAGATTTISLAANFDPKAIILWGTPQSADGTIAGTNFGYGFGTYRGGAVQQAYTTIRGTDAATSADTAGGGGNTAIFKLYSATTPTVDLEIDLTSMQTGATSDVVLTWTNKHTTANVRIHYVIFGGSDVTDAYVDFMDVAGNAAQNETIVAGFGKPNSLFFMHGRAAAAHVDQTGDARLGFGFAHQLSGGTTMQNVGWSYRQTDGNTLSVISALQRDDLSVIVADENGAGGSILGYVTDDSAGGAWPTDGFRIDMATPLGVASNRRVFYLALKGTYQAYTDNNATPTAAPTVVQDNAVGFAPLLGMHFSIGTAASAALQQSGSTLISHGFGAYDGTQIRWAGFTEADGQGTMFADSQQSTVKYQHYGTHAAGGPTVTATAIPSFSGNDLRYSWDDTDTVARDYIFMGFGSAPTGGDTPISIGPIALDLSVSMSRQVNRNAALAMSTAVTLSRVISRKPTVALTLAPTVSRVIQRPISLATTLAASVSRVIQRPISAALTFTPTVGIARLLSRAVSVDFALGATVSRVVNRTQSSALSLSPTVTRVVSRNIPLSLALAPTVSRVVQRVASSALSMVPSVSRVVSRNLSTALTFSVTTGLVRALSMAVNVGFTLSTSVSRVVSRNASVPLTLTPSLSRVVSRQIALALGMVPTVSRVVQRTVGVGLNLVPSVTRIIERRINSALTFTASVIADFVPGLGPVTPINITVPLNFAVNITLGWAGGVVGATRRAKAFFFGRRGIY